MSEDEEDELSSSAEKREKNLMQQMHERVKTLESQISSYEGQISTAEQERDAANTAQIEMKKRLDSKTREYNGLRNQMAIVEATTTSREKEIKDLKENWVNSQTRIDSIV